MIHFTRPIYLLLLLPAVWWTWRLAMHSLSDMSRFRSRLALGLRLAIVVMLVFALAGARMVKSVSQQCAVFVMDVSDSIPKERQEYARAYVNRAIKSLRGDQKAGLVVFGGDASVELAPTNLDKVDRIYSVPSTNQTDISQALGLALASFPEQCAKKIVLLSDGNETMGKAIEQAMLAGSDNVSIDTVPIAGSLPKEALLDKLICPNSMKIGEPFDLKVVAVSKKPALARIRILRDGSPAGQKVVDLAKGKSVFTFTQSIAQAGSYEYRAILETNEDTRPENNIALAYTMVRGKPKVLYVEGMPGQGKYLANALKASDIEVELRDKSGIPNSLAEMRGYDMVVLSDVPAWNMAPEQMEMIKSGVKDLGIGFTMIGGEQSFGAGGYYDTPIEQALPVDMSIRKTKVLPSLSVVIVMDKSGSMSMPEGGRTKIELANDAAASVVKLLQPIDHVGIVVCHSFPVMAVPLRPAANKGPIYAQIQTIRAEGGGIYAVPSLRMAYSMLRDAPTRQKHVIVLADGDDVDDAGGVPGLAAAMGKQKITISTVAFGEGKDVMALKASALAGKGYFYVARYARDLKAIFTKDVMTVSKSLAIEEPFTPRMDPSAPELAGVGTSGVPPLLGYIATSPKPAAGVSMVSHKKDPILATWQYGLGRSAAFTSDCKARWSARWLTWSDYNKFWAQVIRSTMRKSTPGDFQATVDVAGGRGHVVIDAVDDKGAFINMLNFAGSVVGPDMKGRPMAIDQTGPGRYEASFDARETGNYVVNVGKKPATLSTNSATLSTISATLSSSKGGGAPDVNVVSIPYPPEYKDIAPNTGLLRMLSEQTSGKFDPPADQVFGRDFRPSRSYVDLWRFLALLAMVLLPIDVAVRRVAMSPEQIAEAYATVLQLVRARKTAQRVRKQAAAERTESMESLLKVKKPRSSDTPVQPVRIEPPAPSATSSPASAAPPAAPRTEASKPPVPPEPKDGEKKPEGDGSTTSRLLEAKKLAKEGK